MRWVVLPISRKGNEVSHFAAAQTGKEFAATVAVAAHKPDGDLEFFLIGLGGELDHPLGAWAIDGDGLLHECVHALFDGRGEVWHAKTRGCCEDRKVAGTQAVQRLLVGIKTKEDPFLGNIDAFWKLL